MDSAGAPAQSAAAAALTAGEAVDRRKEANLLAQRRCRERSKGAVLAGRVRVHFSVENVGKLRNALSTYKSRVKKLESGGSEPAKLSAARARVVEKERLLKEALDDIQQDPVVAWYDFKRGGIGKQDVRRAEIRRFNAGVWLNDTLVNFNLGVLQERELARCAKEGRTGAPAFHFFDSFFWTRLHGDNRGRYAYEKVQRRSLPEKVGYRVLDCEKLIVPINEGNSHWTLTVVDLQEGRLEHYDSQRRRRNPDKMSSMRHLTRWLEDEAKDKLSAKEAVAKFGSEAPTFADWTATNPVVPQQDGEVDCGVFTLTYADCVARGVAFDFGMADVPQLREHYRQATLATR